MSFWKLAPGPEKVASPTRFDAPDTFPSSFPVAWRPFRKFGMSAAFRSSKGVPKSCMARAARFVGSWTF